MIKYICEVCKRPCKITVPANSAAPKLCPYSIWKTPIWHKVDEEQSVTDCNQLPKLTAEVFDRPDCPEWAQYAAVHNGNLIFTDKKPDINEHGLFISANDTAKIEKILAVPFKSSEHYLSQVIKRPAKKSELPDWCKQGEWIYTSSEQYLKIEGISIDLQKIELSNGAIWNKQDIIDEAVPARLRPYNADEMKALLGKVVTEKEFDYYAYLVTAYTAKLDGKNLVAVGIDDAWVQSDDVLKLYTIDGKPCGILEHLEYGEWVE